MQELGEALPVGVPAALVGLQLLRVAEVDEDVFLEAPRLQRQAPHLAGHVAQAGVVLQFVGGVAQVVKPGQAHGGGGDQEQNDTAEGDAQAGTDGLAGEHRKSFHCMEALRRFLTSAGL
ncbi:hypothetical protein D3C76_1638370 [compost metagenome]